MKPLAILADLLFPISCVGCGIERTWLCPSCRGRLDMLPYRSCPVCRKVSTGGRTCGRCRGMSPLAGLAAAAPYRDPLVRGLIHGLKYDRARSSLPAIEWLVCQSGVAVRIPETDLIIPLPLHRRRLHERGFNQADSIAALLSSKIGVRVAPSILARARQTLPQAKLSDQERMKNVAGAFVVSDPEAVRGKRMLLVDDVFTTGSTMRDGARALREAGASEIWGAAVAYG